MEKKKRYFAKDLKGKSTGKRAKTQTSCPNFYILRMYVRFSSHELISLERNNDKLNIYRKPTCALISPYIKILFTRQVSFPYRDSLLFVCVSLFSLSKRNVASELFMER